jgi:hypothetical protein
MQVEAEKIGLKIKEWKRKGEMGREFEGMIGETDGIREETEDMQREIKLIWRGMEKIWR